jgi:hypothetical protein
MFIATSQCSFKCDKEANCQVCQNSQLAMAPSVEISAAELWERYLNNPITSAIVIAGLEPFDTPDDLIAFLEEGQRQGVLEKKFTTIIIYTGYTEEEIQKYFNWIYIYSFYYPLIIKYGRFIPNQESHFDSTLGVTLASPNQYAKKYVTIKEN